MPLIDNFQYNGPNARAKEFVDTVNQISRLLNGMTLDFGENGGTDVALVEQNQGGLKIDLTRLYIPPPPP